MSNLIMHWRLKFAEHARSLKLNTRRCVHICVWMCVHMYRPHVFASYIIKFAFLFPLHFNIFAYTTTVNINANFTLSIDQLHFKNTHANKHINVCAHMIIDACSDSCACASLPFKLKIKPKIIIMNDRKSFKPSLTFNWYAK